jgi:hypothetical protein
LGIVDTELGDRAVQARKELGEYILDEALITVIASTPYFWVTAPGITVTQMNGYPSLIDFGTD